MLFVARSCVGASLLCVLMSSIVQAQFGFGPPSPDRFFGMLDRNRDGRLDEDELSRVPGPLQERLRSSGADLRRGLSLDDFSRAMDPSRQSDNRSRARSEEPEKKPRPRVTIDLPETWKTADRNGDGQIALYEWERAKFAEFRSLDRNGDGILTPREISRSDNVTPSPASTLPATVVVTSPAVASPVASPASAPSTAPVATTNSEERNRDRKRDESRRSRREERGSESDVTSSGPLQPVAVAPNSSEARWASFVYRTLDKDRDGSLSADEWAQSQTTRQSFEKFNIKLEFPTTLEKLQGYIAAVRQAERRR